MAAGAVVAEPSLMLMASPPVRPLQNESSLRSSAQEKTLNQVPHLGNRERYELTFFFGAAIAWA
jgi:hypothetical protein